MDEAYNTLHAALQTAAEEIEQAQGIENVQSDITLTATWSEIMADEITISGDNLSAGTLTIDDGRSTTLTVTFDPIDTYNKAITWSTDSHYAITGNGDGTYLFEANNSTTENLTVTATTVNGKSASFTLIINEATKLTGLTLNGLTDANTIYTMGGTFSHEGVVVNTTVNMGEAPQNVDAIFSTPDMTTSGVKTITVEYTHAEYGYASTTYEITVNPWHVKLYKNETQMSDIEIISTSQTVTLPTDETEGWAPKVSGYHLAGFATSINAVAPNYSAGATYTPAGDATLYGLYTANMPTYTLIGSANDLEIGRSIIIASKDAVTSTGKNYAAGGLNFTQNGENNNRHAVEVTKSNNGNTLTAYAGATEFILMAGKNPGTYALYDPINGKYACAQATGSNYLKLQDELNEYGSWNITPNSVYAAAGSRNYIFFNSSAKVFACYQSTASQSAIAVYQSDVPVNYEPTQDLVVTDEQTLNTADVDESVNIIVEAGGKVTVADNMTLTVNNLTIESTAGKSGQLIQGEDANVQVTGDIYMDVKFYSAATLDETSANQWYMISAPFDVNLADGFINPVSGVTMHRGNDDNVNTFDLFEYDGEKRATTGTTGWKRVSGKMTAGTACLIGFNPGQPTTIRLKAASNTISDPESISLASNESSVGETDQEKSSNSDWNGIANPRMRYTNVNKDVYVWDNEEGTDLKPGRKYTVFSSSQYSFVVGTPFFVQAAGENDAINFSTATHSGDYLRAPKREVNERIEYCVRITREGANDFADQMYVRASEEASATYERGHDLIAWNGTSGKSALLWSENYGMRLAIEEAPLANNGATYVLGLYAPADGVYTISTPTEDEDATLYLTLNGHIIWNLSQGAYTAELQQGQNSGYGLKIVAAPKVSTDVEQSVVSDQPSVQKVIIDEHVYILRGGQMYDVNGKMVK